MFYILFTRPSPWVYCILPNHVWNVIILRANEYNSWDKLKLICKVQKANTEKINVPFLALTLVICKLHAYSCVVILMFKIWCWWLIFRFTEEALSNVSCKCGLLSTLCIFQEDLIIILTCNCVPSVECIIIFYDMSNHTTTIFQIKSKQMKSDGGSLILTF